MRRRIIALLIAATSIAALAGPASSMAAFYPEQQLFEIPPHEIQTYAPKIKTAYGTCSLIRIRAQIPWAPANAGNFPLTETPTAKCPTGTSLVLGGKWSISGSGETVKILASSILNSPAMQMTVASLPGCKMVATSALLLARWTNGTGFQPYSTYTSESISTNAQWGSNGQPCPLAGTQEPMSYYTEFGVTHNVLNPLPGGGAPIQVR